MEHKQINDDVVSSLGKKMTSPTGAKSLKATCTTKSCEDNCWELTHQTMTRSTVFGLNLCSVWTNGVSWCWSQNAKDMGQKHGSGFTSPAHFSSSETPRVMNLLEQLTSLPLKPAEEITDYLIRAETLSSSLEVAGEKISEKLLVSVVLKGLPDSYEYFRTVHDFQKLPPRFLIWRRFSNILRTRRNWKIAVTRVTLSQRQCCLFREIFLGSFLVNVSAATRAGIWKILVQLNSALFPRCLDTMSLSVFRSKNWIKSLRIGLIFGKVVSFLSIVVLVVRKVKNWLWIPVVRHIYSVIKIFLLNFMMFLRKFLWVPITVFHLWKGKGCQSFLAWQTRCISRAEFKWLSLCSWSVAKFVALDRKGAKVVFDDTCELLCSDKVSFPFVQRNGLYVNKTFSVCSSNFSSTCKVDLDLWHCRLGHNNKRDVQKLSKSIQGMKLHNSSFSESFCCICAANKLNREPPSYKMALRKPSKLELVYSVVTVPMETTSLGGHRYVVTFNDS